MNNLPTEVLLRAIESAVTGIVISDCSLPDMPLIYVNNAFEQLTGYAKKDIIGKNCRFLQGKDTDAYQLDKLRAAIKKGEECKLVLQNYKKDGTPFWNELSISPIYDAHQKLTHFIGIQDNITARVAAEKSLLEAKEIAEEGTRMKTEFLNLISHELRTPLTVMLGNLPLLTDIDDVPEAEEVVEIAQDIEEAGNHLLNLINELLDISRIEQGKLKLEAAPMNAYSAVQDTIKTLQPLADAKALMLKIEMVNFSFMGDEMRVKQVLINLVGNAIKFTKKGSITIKSYTKGDLGYISVIDTGMGMKKEFLPHVFEVFRQADATATRPRSGSGLGLAITKKLMELHNGVISVDSTIGEGSIFTIGFPLLIFDRH